MVQWCRWISSLGLSALSLEVGKNRSECRGDFGVKLSCGKVRNKSLEILFQHSAREEPRKEE